jgi:hypothetical protein
MKAQPQKHSSGLRNEKIGEKEIKISPFFVSPIPFDTLGTEEDS